MKTIDKIITQLDCKYGSPMGRSNEGKAPEMIEPDMTDMVNEKDTYLFNVVYCMRKRKLNKKTPKVFNSAVPFVDGCYDRGGAYWGSPANLRVRYTKDLSYIEFYRSF